MKMRSPLLSKVAIRLLVACQLLMLIACTNTDSGSTQPSSWTEYEEGLFRFQAELQSRIASDVEGRQARAERYARDLGRLLPADQAGGPVYQLTYTASCDPDKVALLVGNDRNDRLIASLYLENANREWCSPNILARHLDKIPPTETDYFGSPVAYTLATLDQPADWKLFLSNSDRWEAIFADTPEVLIKILVYRRCENFQYVRSISEGRVWADIRKRYPDIDAYADSKCPRATKR